MTAVVGIDPSLASAGVAIIERDRFGQILPPRLHTLGHKGHADATWPERSRRIVRQARSILDAVPTTTVLAVIEGPAYGVQTPGVWDRAAVWWGVYSGLLGRAVPVAVCAPATRAQWATGKGNADKTAVLAAMRALWPNAAIADHNQADALALAHAAAQHAHWYGTEELHHDTALAAIAWPQVGAGALR